MMSQSLFNVVTKGLYAALSAEGVTQRYCDSGVLGVFREHFLLRDRLCHSVKSSIALRLHFQNTTSGIGVHCSDSPAINFALGDLVKPSRVFTSQTCTSHGLQALARVVLCGVHIHIVVV